MEISKKLLAIVAVVVITASGSVGYAVVSGAIYLGPKVPGFNITGIGTTDVGVSVQFGVSFDSAPASTPNYLWFANGQSGTGEYFTMSFVSPGVHNISLQVSMSNNHTKRIEYAIETVNPVMLNPGTLGPRYIAPEATA